MGIDVPEPGWYIDRLRLAFITDGATARQEDHDGVDEVCNMLRSSDAAIQQEGATYAAFLAFRGDAARVALCEAGVISLLVSMLKATNLHSQRAASLALVFLSNGCT